MSEAKQPMSLKDKAKLTAQNEIQDELFKEAKDKLLVLYRKKAQAEKVVKNIENEILDYEMELEGK